MDLQSLLDRAEISDIILNFARAFDIKDWDLMRVCLMDEIETDYTDFRDEPPAIVKADDYVASRRNSLDDVKTQHLSTNHMITINGDEAVCLSNAVIYRSLPNEAGTYEGNHYDTHGTYTHTLRKTAQGWKISKIKQTVYWSIGNPLVHGKNRKNTT
jgi:ketosteroid isomerase-like protein